MSKIIFFCIPAHGHTNPTLGVVHELINRGHQVWYYSYNVMREKIEATGATFVACDDYDMEQKLSAKDAVRVGKDLAFSTKLLVDTTLELDDDVCADMQKLQPDCIVADSMAVWGKAVAMKMGIPFVSSTTTFAFNQQSARIMKQGVGELIRLLISMPKIRKDIKHLQDKGYPVKSVLDIIQNDNDTHTIVYTSLEFQPCSETFSDRYAFVGPSIRPAEIEIQKTKNKLVFISMGTVNNDMIMFYKRCISAFADTEYQVIMSVGNLVDVEELISAEEWATDVKNIDGKQAIGGKLPDNISVFSHVDQIAVLKKADVFITHCGMNSVSEALYFSVPLVMFPQTAEQSGVAERVLQLGAGVKIQKADRIECVDGAAILAAVNQVLEDGAFKERVRAIGESFRCCSGAKGAADKILQVCSKIV